MNMIAVISALGVLGALGVLFGALLTVADKKFQVETNELLERVRDALPGANCGACGYVGCDSFAGAVVEGVAKPNGCIPGGAKTATQIGEILGADVVALERPVARVLCQGTHAVAKGDYIYDGYRSCHVAASLSGGPKQCRFACVGLGDCAYNCPFGAIKMHNGIAVIDENLCTGCGACVEVCPRNVIELKETDARVIVRCRNSDVGRAARDVCQRACIACKRCVKECKYDAIVVEDGYARIDSQKCTRCGDCVKVCPCKCITFRD